MELGSIYKKQTQSEGGTGEDIIDNIKSILKREPDFVILHVETNNVASMTSRDILNRLIKLKGCYFSMGGHRNVTFGFFLRGLRYDFEKIMPEL